MGSEMCIRDRIRDIHFQGATIAVTNPELIPSHKRKTSQKTHQHLISLRRNPPSLPSSAQSELSVKFKVDIPKIGQGEQTHDTYGSSLWDVAVFPMGHKETEEHLDLWIAVNYNQNWFYKSTSNIQRLLKNSTEVIAGDGTNGVKRGMWIGSNHIEESIRSLQTNFEMLEKLSKEVLEFAHQMDLKILSERHQVEQLKHQLRYLTQTLEEQLEQQYETTASD